MLDETMEKFSDALQPRFDTLEGMAHEEASKHVLLRSEVNTLTATQRDFKKQIQVLRAGLEGQGAMITALQKRARPEDDEEINISNLADQTPVSKPKDKKSKKKPKSNPAKTPSTRSPRIAAKQAKEAENM